MITVFDRYSIRSDGKIIIEPEKIPEIIFETNINPSKILALYSDFDVEEFNKRSEQKIELFDGEDIEISNEQLQWNIPSEYSELFLFDYIFNLYEKRPQEEKNIIRYQRILDELTEIKNRKLENLFRTIIYIVSEFRKNNIVWGVGRGSSCASYVLYLIGVHSVDPVKYHIDYSEFFHD